MRDRLRRVSILEGLSDATLERLAESTNELRAPAGRVLVELGQPGSGLFVLEEGTAVVEMPGAAVELAAGDLFGEIAVVGAAERRTARVTARTDVCCLAIGRPVVERLLADEPDLADRLRRLAHERLWGPEGGG